MFYQTLNQLNFNFYFFQFLSTLLNSFLIFILGVFFMNYLTRACTFILIIIHIFLFLNNLKRFNLLICFFNNKETLRSFILVFILFLSIIFSNYSTTTCMNNSPVIHNRDLLDLSQTEIFSPNISHLNIESFSNNSPRTNLNDWILLEASGHLPETVRMSLFNNQAYPLRFFLELKNYTHWVNTVGFFKEQYLTTGGSFDPNSLRTDINIIRILTKYSFILSKSNILIYPIEEVIEKVIEDVSEIMRIDDLEIYSSSSSESDLE